MLGASFGMVILLGKKTVFEDTEVFPGEDGIKPHPRSFSSKDQSTNLYVTELMTPTVLTSLIIACLL